MCGRIRFTADAPEVRRQFGALGNATLPHRYNLPPGTDIPVILEKEGSRLLRTMYWGLVPPWAKERNIGYRMINARAETLQEKPSFRKPLERRRCVIPVNGYYEWQHGTKQPYYFQSSNDDTLLGFAGLHETWRHGEETLESCTIITVAANGLMQAVHHRMPCSLRPDALEKWLAPDTSAAQAQALLVPPADESLTCWPVSTEVNNPRLDAPQLIENSL